MNEFGIDIKEHLELIVIAIVLVSTLPVIIKFFFKKEAPDT